MDADQRIPRSDESAWPLADGTIPDKYDISALLDLASDITAEAAALARDRRDEALSDIGSKSNLNDVVTAADKAAEDLIVARLAAARPGDAVIGEESGSHGRVGPGVVRWIVDPIDGTVNYVYGIPSYAVCLAAAVDGRLLAGVVRNIGTGTVYRAAAGRGADRDGERISCSRAADLGRALVNTGFGYDPLRRARQGAVVAAILPHIRDIRRGGSAALELCALAEGAADGYFERGLNVWDYAAAGLVAAEAGAVVSDLRTGRPSGSMVMAAAPGVYEELRALLLKHDADRDA